MNQVISTKKFLDAKDILKISLASIVILGIFLLLLYILEISLPIKTLILNAGSVFAILLPILYFSRKKDLTLKDFGFAKINRKWFFFSFLLAFGVLTLSGLLSKISPGPSLPQGILSDKMWLNILNFKILIGILIPFAEEVYFRGIIFRYLREKNTFFQSAIISSFLFGLLHLNPSMIIFAFLLGFVSAFAFEKSKSIIPSFFIHTIINSLAMTFFLLS